LPIKVIVQEVIVLEASFSLQGAKRYCLEVFSSTETPEIAILNF
jgi:hypothetical protein